MSYHKPVLLDESVEGLNIRPEGVYADLTFGGGGHSLRILGKLGKKGRLLGFDQDTDAVSNAPSDKRFTFVHSNFRFLKNFIRYYNIGHLDGIIADLGISSHQVDKQERGFSFMAEANADMRMNRQMNLTAADILNQYPEDQLMRVLREYGEIPNAREMVRHILKTRQAGSFMTTQQLVNAIQPVVPERIRNKQLARVFQALRIEVNDELGALKEMLHQSVKVLKPQGRLVILSYHSLEDRMVKNFIRSGNTEGVMDKDFYGNVSAPFRAVNRNVIVPSDEEIRMNPRARSAKLRIAEKL